MLFESLPLINLIQDTETSSEEHAVHATARSMQAACHLPSASKP
jgi:hypothetical protein